MRRKLLPEEGKERNGKENGRKSDTVFLRLPSFFPHGAFELAVEPFAGAR